MKHSYFWLIIAAFWFAIGCVQAHLGNAWLALLDGLLVGLNVSLWGFMKELR